MLLACADQEQADRADLIPASHGTAGDTVGEGGLERRASSRLLDSADDLRPLARPDAADLDSAAGHRIRGGETAVAPAHRPLAWPGLLVSFQTCVPEVLMTSGIYVPAVC